MPEPGRFLWVLKVLSAKWPTAALAGKGFLSNVLETEPSPTIFISPIPFCEVRPSWAQFCKNLKISQNLLFYQNILTLQTCLSLPDRSSTSSLINTRENIVKWLCMKRHWSKGDLRLFIWPRNGTSYSFSLTWLMAILQGSVWKKFKWLLFTQSLPSKPSHAPLLRDNIMCLRGKQFKI